MSSINNPEGYERHQQLLAEVETRFLKRGALLSGPRQRIFPHVSVDLLDYGADTLLWWNGVHVWIDAKTGIHPLTGNVSIAAEVPYRWLNLTESTQTKILVVTEDGKMDDSEHVINLLVGKRYGMFTAGAEPLVGNDGAFYTYHPSNSRDTWRV